MYNDDEWLMEELDDTRIPAWEERLWDTLDYWEECRKCGVSVWAYTICSPCHLEEEEEKMYDIEDQVYTKAERREAKKGKAKYGMIRHLEPNIRPVKIRRPKVTVKERN
jgi:hypothetical protein